MGNCTPTQKPNSSTSQATPVNQVDIIQVMQNETISQHYNFHSIIGKGTYGKIILSTAKYNPSLLVAIKAIPKEKYVNSSEEISLLKELDHPNIVKYIESFDTARYLYIVMEYCPGGELYDHILESKLTEKDASSILCCLLKAINHCHSLNILHRDIKPENIMYSSKDPKAELKIIDFGLSKKAEGTIRMYTNDIVGTPYYMPPESAKGIYCKSSDVWSLGILMYLLLTGYLPFGGNCKEEIVYKIEKFKGFNFENTIWSSISSEAKDLLTNLVNPSCESRISAYNALQHPWIIKGQSDAPLFIDPSIFDAIREYKNTCIARQKLLNIIISSSSNEQIAELKRQFDMLDTEKTGYLSMEHIKTYLKGKYDEDLLKSIDDSVHLNYSEFVAAAVSYKSFFTEESLHIAYGLLNNGNQITCTDLKASRTLRKRINTHDANELMDMFDKNKDGALDYAEFKEIFSRLPNNLYPQ